MKKFAILVTTGIFICISLLISDRLMAQGRSQQNEKSNGRKEVGPPPHGRPLTDIGQRPDIPILANKVFTMIIAKVCTFTLEEKTGKYQPKFRIHSKM